ncbi:E3 ubiquitin-protein ligase APD2-like isoform X2 [Tripterygium wilfordii]|uniref:E3 ubiquitin-protein ligase APD2-like isoform X2 n=1 Tax=Tripterygium wilfordii TaxID=458696 RepID=UPI0018F84414|nr:E3 ubiquitin-protein ligase APD2-like isoform X2 [Tripterygium wilfordii]
MAEAADRSSTSTHPPSCSGSSNRDSSPSNSAVATASSNSPPSSSSSSQVREEEEGQNHDIDQQNQFREHEIEQQRIVGFHRGSFWTFNDMSNVVRDDTWSCIIVVLTFWLFVSITLILGVYGSLSLRFGPSSSILIRPSPIFVQSIKVEELGETKPGLILYGLYRSPPLDVVSTWSKTINASVPANSHKELIYFLNEGSQINISYCVKSDSSIYLIIAQEKSGGRLRKTLSPSICSGNEGLARWLEDPTYPNSTLSWNVIQGSGIIKQNIWRSSSYYVALGNLNSEAVEMNLSVQALLYNTSEAYSKCMFTHGVCSLRVLFPQGNAFVVNSPGVGKGSTSDEWNVKLSYGPRWLTYILGIGGLTVLMLVAFNCLNKFQFTREDGDGHQFRETGSERAHLLSHKDDDLSSWGSSYDSVSNDEEDLGDFLAPSTIEGQSSRDGENGNNTRRLCAICFDAPRDCFFLPCGHCVACFACGTRIAEAAGTCPICRRSMKKVRKIFTV